MLVWSSGLQSLFGGGANSKDENGVTIGQLAETLKAGTKIGALCDEGESLIIIIV